MLPEKNWVFYLAFFVTNKQIITRAFRAHDGMPSMPLWPMIEQEIMAMAGALPSEIES